VSNSGVSSRFYLNESLLKIELKLPYGLSYLKHRALFFSTTEVNELERFPKGALSLTKKSVESPTLLKKQPEIPVAGIFDAKRNKVINFYFNNSFALLLQSFIHRPKHI
jgi:hypothetical protein